MTRAVFSGMGHGLPKRIVTNDEIATMVDTNDEWIRQRTGICQRRIVSEGESTVSLSVQAAQEALSAAKIDAKDLDLVLVATVTPDRQFPSAACMVQDAIGAGHIPAFDLSAACSGFVYGVSVASSMLRAGEVKRALVVGVDTLSRVVDWTDRSTCILFGDGAGAAVLTATEGTDRGLIASALYADGSGGKHIKIEAGGSLHPMNDPASAAYRSTVEMNGPEVYRFAVQAMGDACQQALKKAGMKPSDVDIFVPHQANRRIIDSAAQRLNLQPEKVFLNVHKYGNTSGGSIPLALYEAEVEGMLQRGMVVMTVGFGAGLTWGANLTRW